MGHCMLCDAPSSGRQVWCPRCSRMLAVYGRCYSDWPPAIKALYLDMRREQYRITRDRQREVDTAGRYDCLTQGEDGASVEMFHYEWDTSGGPLRCLNCGNVYSDFEPTWPLPTSRWQVPICPRCEGGWFADGDSAERDTSRTPLLQEVALDT